MPLARPFLRFVTACAVAAFSAPLGAQDSSAVPASQPRTSADSTFTEEQAERGGKVFIRVCVECHERIEMSNDDFRLKWGGQTTFDLFQNISTTMPDSDPGILPRGDYLDVVSYILRLNGVPAGPVELAEDSASMSVAKLNLPLSTAVPAAVMPAKDTTVLDTTAKDTTAKDTTAKDTTARAAAARAVQAHRKVAWLTPSRTARPLYFPHASAAPHGR